MKKIIGASLLLLGSTLAQADIAGAKAGLEYWPTKDHDDAISAYAQLEHPIPLLPNLAVRGTYIEGNYYNLNNYDFYGYYEILDNDLVSIDLGFGAHQISRSGSLVTLVDDTMPMITSDIELMPGSNVSFYGKMNYAENDDTRMTDLSAGVRFNIIPGINLQAGYRQYELEQQGTLLKFSDTIEGATMGLHIDI